MRIGSTSGGAFSDLKERKQMAARRFPPPWIIEDIDAAFVVKDNAEQKLAYVYYEEEPGRRSATKMLSRDEARRIAANIAKAVLACRALSVVVESRRHY